MRQVFGEWGVVTETKSASYGTICGNDFFNRLKGMFSTYILSQLEISFFDLIKRIISISKNTKEVIF